MAYIAQSSMTNYQLSARFQRLGALLRQWRQRSREREQLARLSERDLHDLGLSRGTVYAEVRKPFWRE